MVTGSEDGFRGTRPNDDVWLFGDTPGGGKERVMNAKRSGMRLAGALAAVLATASMSGVVAGWASAADAPSGRSGVLSVSGRYGNRALAGCDYYQINTPPPVGDHRWAVNNTCDGGLRHWFTIGSWYNEGRSIVRPSTPSDYDCTRINSYGTIKVPAIGGSCVFVASDLLPLINDWGNIFY